MPPKAKFTRAEIIEAALNIVRTDGYEALTSRALGTYLGSSDVYKRQGSTLLSNVTAAHTRSVIGNSVFNRLTCTGVNPVNPSKIRLQSFNMTERPAVFAHSSNTSSEVI